MGEQPTTTAATFRVSDDGSSTLQAQRVRLVRGRRVVLRDVDFAVEAGETVALLGANGAGKTTLLQCLAGILRPAAGEVFWLGEAAARSPAARRLIGYLAHETGLYLELTARENLVFAGRMYGIQAVSDRVAELLAAVGLQGKASQAVHRLSLGMRRRLAVARAVIHDPPIVLLDEPFANLDADYRRWLADFLVELRRKRRAVCFTSHDPDRCREIADRRVCLQEGRLDAVDDNLRQASCVVSCMRRA